MRTPEAGAVVVAAGRGERFGGKKVFERLEGRTVLERAVGAVAAGPRVGVVVVVVAAGDERAAQRALSGFDKVEAVVTGDERRQDSVANGLAALPGTELVLVHDGSRPLASPALVERVLDGAAEWGACVPVLPVVDTLKRVAPGGKLVAGTLPRDDLFAVQTPQGFRRAVLAEAFELARRRGLAATDEAALVEACGRPVAVVEGERTNIKLTYREDLALVRALLEKACAQE